MGYKFKCQKCSSEIIVKYCFIGDIIECKNCKAKVFIPEDAMETGEKPQYLLKIENLQSKERMNVFPEKSNEEGIMTLTKIGNWRFINILGELFRVYGKNFIKFISLSIIILFIFFLLSLPVMISIDIATDDDTDILISPVYILTSLLLLLIILPLMHCVIIYAISKQYFTKSFSISLAFRAALRKLGTAIVALVSRIITFILLLITIVGIPFAFDLWISWIFAFNVIVIENVRNPFDAFKRSSELIEGYWWRSFGMILIFNAIAVIINLSLRRIPILSMFGAALSCPIITIGYTLLYFDLRVRKEGYSLQKLAEELKINIPASASKK